MKRGGLVIICGGLLACSACLGDPGKLEVRSVDRGLKAGPEPVPFRIAEARGHLALGNVGLALEGFRKAARDDPASIEALAGMAQCYDRMGRFDLSRKHYERALAIAPRNVTLLGLLAASFDLQGLRGEAAAVRGEMASLGAADQPAPVAMAEGTVPREASAPAPQAVAPAPQIVAAAPEIATPVGQSVTIALPPARPAGETKPPARAPEAMALAPVGHSVTVALPAPRPAPTAKASASTPDSKVATGRQPRLVRISLTEVALVTGDGPRWKRPAAPITRMAGRVTPSQPVELRLLNAARVDKLAARTRAFLGRYGWHSVAVGDAAAIRQRSLIVYPKGAKAAASRLSARFGFAMAPRNDVRQLTILLGRDAAILPALRPKG